MDSVQGGRSVPLLLAGAWEETDADREVVRGLTRLSADELDRTLARWANGVDPPVRKVGGVWDWVARRRAWPHLARYVGGADLAAFRRAVLDVLGEPDPRLGLPPDDRWAAAVHGRAPRFSARLREGLAGGLALLATRAAAAPPGSDAEGFARGVVRDVFGPAPDPGRWYALAGVLRPLAEAAPDAFLDVVERDVLGSAEVMAALFQDEGVFGGGRHTHLLWALEVLAWCPDYLTRVAVVLARLAARDPGGRTANRPAASLAAVLLPWLPGTNAPVAARFAAVDAAAGAEPAVAFDLCLGMLPRGHGIATPTARPEWRPWRQDRPDRATPDEWAAAVGLAFDRLLRWAGRDPARWARVVDAAHHLEPDQGDRLVEGLERAVGEGLPADADALRTAVRRALRHVRGGRAGVSAFAPEALPRLEAVGRALDPADPVARHAWLFAHTPELPAPREGDWEAEHRAVAAERERAVREVLAVRGPDGVAELAARAEVPFLPGQLAAQTDPTDDRLIGLLERGLDAPPGPLRTCAFGLVGGRLERGGWAWVDRLFVGGPAAEWPAGRRARFACALPFEAATWDRVDGWGADAAGGYWRDVTPFAVRGDVPRDGERAVRALLAHGRPFDALDLARHCLPGGGRGGVPAGVLLDVLRAATNALASGQPARPDMAGYALEGLLDAVEAAGVADEGELARLEWAWLPVLEHSRRGWRTLHRGLSRDPTFFAWMVCQLYRPRHRPAAVDGDVGGEPDPQARLVAERAWRVLREWRSVPGAGPDGAVDGAALAAWTAAARAACRAADRAEVGDSQIGQVLAHSPPGADGQWPHEAVRAVIEAAASEELDRGFYLGVMNSRGITSRTHDTGGEPERALAERYRGYAATLAAAAPRTAAALRAVADSYDRDARREDDRRDLDEFD